MAAEQSVVTSFRALDRVSGVMSKMSGAVKKFGKVSEDSFARASRSSSRFWDIVKGVISANVIMGGVRMLVSGFKTMISEASKLENSLVKFKVLLGGDEAAAQKMVDQLTILGASTPFEFEDLANATTMLLGFNAATKDKVIPTLRMLGDLSLGNAENMKGVTLAFSQIKAAGKASMQDVNQLINAQVPILATLADQWGVTVGQAREMISKGRATSDEVEKAFKKMTSAGGQFHNGMLEASKTFSGLTSTLSDNIKQTAAGIGMQLLPAMKEGAIFLSGMASGVLEWVIANKELINQNITGFVNGIKIGFTFIKPLLISAFTLFKNIGSSIGTMNWEPLVKALKIIASLFKILIDIIQVLWVIAKPVIDGILYLLNPIIDAISWIVDGMGKFSSYLSKIFAGNGEGQKTVEKTVQKTINTGTEKNQEQRQIIAPNQNQAAAVKNSMNVNVNTNVNAPEGYKVDTSVKSRPVSGNMGVNK